MVVVIANAIPPAVRGRMKLWFIEPRPNIFISGIKDSVSNGVIQYLFDNCNKDCGLLVFQQISKPPFYKIWGLGDSNRSIASFEGMQLIFEKLAKE